MNALVLLFIKLTKQQNGHQKKKNPPKQETLTHFSNKSDSSIRRPQSYDPQNRTKYKYEQENTE